MICFGQYALENGYKGYPETFAAWMKNSKDDLHSMIENGKVKHLFIIIMNHEIE